MSASALRAWRTRARLRSRARGRGLRTSRRAEDDALKPWTPSDAGAGSWLVLPARRTGASHAVAEPGARHNQRAPATAAKRLQADCGEHCHRRERHEAGCPSWSFQCLPELKVRIERPHDACASGRREVDLRPLSRTSDARRTWERRARRAAPGRPRPVRSSDHRGQACRHRELAHPEHRTDRRGVRGDEHRAAQIRDGVGRQARFACDGIGVAAEIVEVVHRRCSNHARQLTTADG